MPPHGTVLYSPVQCRPPVRSEKKGWRTLRSNRVAGIGAHEGEYGHSAGACRALTEGVRALAAVGKGACLGEEGTLVVRARESARGTQTMGPRRRGDGCSLGIVWAHTGGCKGIQWGCNRGIQWAE